MTDFALVRGRRVRITKVDNCGNVVLGPANRVVSKGFVTMGFTPNNTTVEALTVTNANGEECVREEGSSKFSNHTVAGTFCKVMPELFSMITGMPAVYDAAGLEAIGIRYNSQIEIDLSAWALELWSKVPQANCGPSGLPSFGYALAPFIGSGTLSGITFENAAITFGIEAATTKDGNNWGAGPYNVELNDSGVTGKLNHPLDPYDHLELIKVQVPPPDETDGAEAVGVPATGAAAGTPGTFTPTNSYAPLNLAGMTGVTASPSSAWTTGQYVPLRDGSRAKWNGTAWVAA